MQGEELVRQLRRLKRVLEQLESEFAHQRVDEGLLADIDRMLEDGLAADERVAELKDGLDDLRESTLSQRAELYADGIRACRGLKARIESLAAMVG